MFALKDRSMIGKRFKKMFPTFGGPTREVINFAEHEKGGPRILQNVLFDPNNGELRPVYGKVVSFESLFTTLTLNIKDRKFSDHNYI